MAVQLKTLSHGSLGETSGQAPKPLNMLYELYRVPSGKGTIVKAMRFVNTHNAPVPFTVVLRSATLDDKPLFPKDAYLKDGLMLVVDEELLLGSGDAIWAKVGKDGDAGNASYAGKLDFVISGVERDLQS